MAPPRRPRLLVDLDPVVYATAVARVLRHADVDDVVVGRAHDVDGPFDVAVVDGPDDVDADVVIHLPGTALAGDGVVVETVTIGGTTQRITPTDLLAVLDRVRPGPHPRRARGG